MNPIRVFIVDDHNLFRRGVTTVLQDEPQFECVGEADSGLDAVRRAPETRADLVLLDMNMPGMSGLAAMATLRELLPRARFVLITCTLEASELRRAYAAGARIEPYTRVPRYIELARLLQGEAVTPSELRRRARVGVSDLRRFLQAALMLGLLHWQPLDLVTS